MFRPPSHLLALVLLLAAVPLGAQETEAHRRQAALQESIRAELNDTSRRWVGVARLRASYPQRLSAGLGVLSSRLPTAHACAGTCDYQGLIAQVEPGLAGGQLAVGWARVVGERRGGGPILTHVYLGWGVRAVLLRTWGEASLTPPDQTLAGIEGQFSVARASFSLGLLRPISTKEGEDDDLVIAGGLGWGF